MTANLFTDLQQDIADLERELAQVRAERDAALVTVHRIANLVGIESGLMVDVVVAIRERLEAGERLAGAAETTRKWLGSHPEEVQHLSLLDVQTLLGRALATWRGQPALGSPGETGEPEA